MKLEDIFTEWEKDSKVDLYNLSQESIKIPKLHHKYYEMFSKERLILRRMEGDFKILARNKHDWYSGTLDEDTLRELEWEPYLQKIMRSDVSTFVDSDSDIIQYNLKLALQREKVELLESIIKSLTNRGFQIKAAIDFERFKAGSF